MTQFEFVDERLADRRKISGKDLEGIASALHDHLHEENPDAKQVEYEYLRDAPLSDVAKPEDYTRTEKHSKIVDLNQDVVREMLVQYEQEGYIMVLSFSSDSDGMGDRPTHTRTGTSLELRTITDGRVSVEHYQAEHMKDGREYFGGFGFNRARLKNRTLNTTLGQFLKNHLPDKYKQKLMEIARNCADTIQGVNEKPLYIVLEKYVPAEPSGVLATNH